jgi:hypothetical protein
MEASRPSREWPERTRLPPQGTDELASKDPKSDGWEDVKTNLGTFPRWLVDENPQLIPLDGQGAAQTVEGRPIKREGFPSSESTRRRPDNGQASVNPVPLVKVERAEPPLPSVKAESTGYPQPLKGLGLPDREGLHPILLSGYDRVSIMHYNLIHYCILLEDLEKELGGGHTLDPRKWRPKIAAVRNTLSSGEHLLDEVWQNYAADQATPPAPGSDQMVPVHRYASTQYLQQKQPPHLPPEDPIGYRQVEQPAHSPSWEATSYPQLQRPPPIPATDSGPYQRTSLGGSGYHHSLPQTSRAPTMREQGTDQDAGQSRNPLSGSQQPTGQSNRPGRWHNTLRTLPRWNLPYGPC